MKFIIKFDKYRYTDSKGAKKFGHEIIVECENKEQAQEIADALSGYHEAGLTDQFYIEEDEER